ncbi:electron transporter RnfC [Achromatium sp. WMS3]|nr:electron transporter RnfC [Achromatium sp. WMS3]
MDFMNLLRRNTFAHGIHPEDHKELTNKLPIRRLPFAPQLLLPLAQHLGAPAKPIVGPRQEVGRGEVIAVAQGFVSVPLHAPATGVIKAIELVPTALGPKTQAIILDVYQGDSQEVLTNKEQDPFKLNTEAIIQAVQDIGLVGQGGAAFPSHVKLKPPKDAVLDTLMVNGCECEPYLTCDHRIMLEHTKDLLTGIRIALQALGLKRAMIAVEDNKPDAIKAITKVLPADGSITVHALETKYPQGAEKMVISALTGRQVPSGKLPSHVGVAMFNVGTLTQIGALLPQSQGLIERVVTVSGLGVQRPGNYRVPVGTPLRFLLNHVGATAKANEVILGGPMMGMAVASLDVPVTKAMSGVVVLEAGHTDLTPRKIHPCIRCGRCVEACPMHLNPSMLGLLATKRQYDTMAERYHLLDCFECGCCSYVCPSNIPLVQYFRIAKAINREQQAA